MEIKSMSRNLGILHCVLLNVSLVNQLNHNGSCGMLVVYEMDGLALWWMETQILQLFKERINTSSNPCRNNINAQR